MRAFAEAYQSEQIVQHLAGQLPWWHNVVIMTRLKDPDLREWYIRACIENGWSRAVLLVQIETSLHERTGKAMTNFSRTLPAQQSELAQQLLKDPYSFEFLTTYDDESSTICRRDCSITLRISCSNWALDLHLSAATTIWRSAVKTSTSTIWMTILSK